MPAGFSQSKIQQWGLTTKPNELTGNDEFFYSDGTNNITVFDVHSWTQTKVIPVSFPNGTALEYINEMEIVQTTNLTRNYIFCNVYMTDNIHLIDMRSGLVVKSWDMSELKQNQNTLLIQRPEPTYDTLGSVLNGIAYRKDMDSFVISGKLWDNIYDIKFDYKKYMK